MLLPPRQATHGMTPDWSHDDKSRQAFQRSLRECVIRDLSNGSRLVFENQVSPKFEKENGRPFQNRQEIKAEMRKEPFYQAHLSIQRAAQELMWASVTYSLDRQIDEMMAKAKQSSDTLGSLTVNPDMPIPKYIDSLDIHCMPGGYTTDLCDGDISAGAIYDKGSYMYGSGRGGPYGDRSGQSIVNYLKREHPDFAPKRILDMGCATGNNTVPFCDAYPDADVHGIELGAALLRYGHARTESLGKAIHFSQQNAEQTNFEDESFDLIVSCIIFHETSRKALPRIIAETRRLLKPGGLMVHLEAGQFENFDLWRQTVFDAETYNNNEPFWSTYRDMNLEAVIAEAGWPDGTAHLHLEPFGHAPVTSSNKSQKNMLGFWFMVGQK
jgi:SAM-dependent methyltransferase